MPGLLHRRELLGPALAQAGLRASRAVGHHLQEEKAEEKGDASIVHSLSQDGRYVAFYSTATTLVSGDTNGAWDVFVRDLQAGVTTRLSVIGAGVQANGATKKQRGQEAKGSRSKGEAKEEKQRGQVRFSIVNKLNLTPLLLLRIRSVANLRIPLPSGVVSRGGALLRAGGRIAMRALGPLSVVLSAIDLIRQFSWARSVVALSQEIDTLETAVRSDFSNIFRGRFIEPTLANPNRRLVRGPGSQYPYSPEEFGALLRYWRILTYMVNELPEGWYDWSMETIAKRGLRQRLQILETRLGAMYPGEP